MEMATMAKLDGNNNNPQDGDDNLPGSIAVQANFVGHKQEVTSAFFSFSDDELVTASLDRTIRFWSVATGEILKVFTDSSPIPVAAFLPFNSQRIVTANSNAVLQLVNVEKGLVLQKLKIETEVRALKFDDTGVNLFAGTQNGSIHVLEAVDSNTLHFKFKTPLSRGKITCITFVKQQKGSPNPPCLLVNTAENSVAIVDCVYAHPTGELTNLAVRKRVTVAHSILGLKNCFSPSGNGYLISGSEDKQVVITSLGDTETNSTMQNLKHHAFPVLTVALNAQDTLLASGDSLGSVVLWRRIKFTHQVN